MKYIGLDLGSKTLGIAISDSMGMIARTYGTYRFNDDDYDSAVNYIIGICKKELVNDIVLGMPKHMNGDIGIRGNISNDFKRKIEELSSIKVSLWDERLSTVSANRVMLQGNMSREKRKEKKDELAAVVILQAYLEFKTF